MKRLATIMAVGAVLALGACGSEEASGPGPGAGGQVGGAGGVGGSGGLGGTAGGSGGNAAGQAGASGEGGVGGVGGSGGAAGAGGQGNCHRVPLPEDATRKVVVAHPYDEKSQKDKRYAVLELSLDGALKPAGDPFSMGRGNTSVIEFTPDGQVGIALQEGGNLGVFRFTSGGTVEVVHAEHDPGVYLSKIMLDATGERLFAVSSQWEKHGGGLYEIPVGCDGALGAKKLITPAHMPYTFNLRPSDGRAIVGSYTLLGSAEEQEVHLLDLAQTKREASVDAFEGKESMLEDGELSLDESVFLVGDYSEFSGIPNSVAVLRVGDKSLTKLQSIPIEDPRLILASPFGNAFMVVSTFKNKVEVLAYDPTNMASPITHKGSVAYTSAAPELPIGAVVLRRGTLKGTVLVAEVTTIRRLAFTPAGKLEEQGRLNFGSGTEQILGAIGIQP